jgi:hypothetical protein
MAGLGGGSLGQPLADTDDRPFEMRRCSIGNVLIGAGCIIQAGWSGFEIPAPPLLEPGWRAIQRLAKLVHLLAGQT